jgi:predicted O-methyltransferase YrrM
MHMKNAPNQFRNACRSLWAACNPGAPMGSLHRSLGWRLLTVEGFLGRKQAEYLRELATGTPAVTRIAEIGFNAGHSACVFLAARPDISVVSFDLGAHRYVGRAKAFMDRRFPGRHTLVLGDSRDTVPKFHADYPEMAFDLVFIDGGHDYDVVAADLFNCRLLTAPGGRVLIDDLRSWKTWGHGPVRAWSEARQQGIVEELQLIQDGQQVTDVRRKRWTSAWAVGRYVTSTQALLR